LEDPASGGGAGSAEERLGKRFELRTEPFRHGGVSLDILLPRSADALIDPAEFERDERLPYWADLWPSARALARHLIDHPPAPGTRVLELGCGVALPSLVLAATGYRVLATDYDEDALHFARVNAERNGIPPLDARALDWRHRPAAHAADLVLAADVLYERRNAEALAALLPSVVAQGGSVLLADPGRVYLGELFSRLEPIGWACAAVEERTEVSAPASGAVSRVRILRLRPPSPPGR
jgi:predicted nicotinamide N-methyase